MLKAKMHEEMRKFRDGELHSGTPMKPSESVQSKRKVGKKCKRKASGKR
jgi:hypothetical protein